MTPLTIIRNALPEGEVPADFWTGLAAFMALLAMTPFIAAVLP